MTAVYRNDRITETRKIALELYAERYGKTEIVVDDETLKATGCWDDADDAIDCMLMGECY